MPKFGAEAKCSLRCERVRRHSGKALSLERTAPPRESRGHFGTPIAIKQKEGRLSRIQSLDL